MSIDAALGRLGIQTGVCTSSTRPANPYEGQVIYETDTNNLRFWSGSAWESNKGAAISSAAPSSPAAGDIWYDSDDGRAYVYYNDGSSQQWVEFGAPAVQHGKILQIQTTTVTTGFATTSTSYVDVTGVSVSITPTSASNNVLVMVQGFGGNNTNNIAKVNLLRGATNIAQSTGSGIADQTLLFSTTSDRDTAPIGIIYLDSPATTSATTYKIQLASTQAATTVAIGQRAVDSNWQGVTTITAMEVSA